MFKPGDKVEVTNAGNKCLTVVIAVPKSERTQFEGTTLVNTQAGRFLEADLVQAHPTVVATANNSNFVGEVEEEEEISSSEPVPYLDIDLRLELSEAVIKAVKAGTVDTDTRGHWKHGDTLDPYSKNDLFSPFFVLDRELSQKDAEALLDVLTFNSKGKNKNDKKTLPGFLKLGKTISTFKCSYCDVGRFSLETNGKTVRLSGDDCSAPDGCELNEWELNVPSGKLVVANNLRSWFPLLEDDSYDINGLGGRRMTTLDYADTGLSYAFVGNSCPSVFADENKENTYKISNKPEEEDEDTGLANICTDLWWYSICDFDEFSRRCEKFGGSLEDAYAEVVDVKPGVYRFRHDDEADYYSSPEETVYSTFEWVREADPVRDFLGEYEQVTVNANAYVHAMVQAWPTLFHGEEADGPIGVRSWQSAANQIFCTIGSGVEWHENGFPASEVDQTIPDIEPPSFREQYNWYPFSKDYGGLFQNQNFAPSFAKLAFRTMESIISFGMRVDDSRSGRAVNGVRNRMLLAVDRYRELSKVYHDLADPEYISWLSKPGRAEAWVARFRLGDKLTQKHLDDYASQRWVPEGSYAVEFDANKLNDGTFVGDKGYWSNKENAVGYAIKEHSGTICWASNAVRTTIPLSTVARVVGLGGVSQNGNTMIELEFDYGNEWMKNHSQRKAIDESENKEAMRILTKEEYEVILKDKKAQDK